MSKSNPNSVTVSADYDINRMTNTITANVSGDLFQQISRKLLGEVCEQLFGTPDVEYVRDVFAVLARDARLAEKITALRTARRIGARP